MQILLTLDKSFETKEHKKKIPVLNLQIFELAQGSTKLR